MTMFADKTLESTTTTGTGTYGLDGAPSGWRTFVTGFGTGALCAYYAQVADGSIWEAGIGTVTDATPDTLTRDTILASSNSGAKINWGAGTKYLSSIPNAVILSALLKGNIGTSRPAWLEAGGQWIDNSGTPWEVYLFDGTDDTLIYAIDMSTGAISFPGDTTVKSTDAGTTGPTLSLYHDSDSPAADDTVGLIPFKGNNDAAEETIYARLRAVLADATDGAEDGRLSIDAMTAGTLAAVLHLAQGIWTPNATGGDPGPDIINALGFQIDGDDAWSIVDGLFASTGFVRFSNGFVINWGRPTVSANSIHNATLSQSYTTEYGAIASGANQSTAEAGGAFATPLGTTQVRLINSVGSSQVIYFWSWGKI
ncbi:hypothetical protein [Rhodospirillaceae bacterium SYSU D60014]|uniref:hypothetical protein n=1 Tax=Virgifigura deserti TaxID=2268457 RepID=UPI000E67266B